MFPRAFITSLSRIRRYSTPAVNTATVPSSNNVNASNPKDVSLQTVKLLPQFFNKYLYGNGVTVGGEVGELWMKRLQLPPLKGTAYQHLQTVSSELFEPYKVLLERAITISENLPVKPKEWAFKTGWTKYLEDGSTVLVEAPDSDLLFFDVEVCVIEGQLPTLAVALSETNWYSWCSPRLVEDTPVPDLVKPEHLIPMEDSVFNKKMVIGHNVGYDRARIREQYNINGSTIKVWDTMSMNTVIQGMADHQRQLYEKKDVDEASDVPWLHYWRSKSCKNSLDNVYIKLFPEKSAELNKTLQSVFVTESMEVIRHNFQTLTDYCAGDVKACCEIYSQLYPTFKERFPSDSTYMGMVIMSDAYLPVTSNWRDFFKKCDSDSDLVNNASLKIVVSSAKKVIKDLQENNKFEFDPWHWVSDWKQKYRSLPYPAWYVNLFSNRSFLSVDESELKRGNVKLGGADIPRIFGICYGSYPLFYKREYGWGFLKPIEAEIHEEILDVTLQRQDTVKFPARVIRDLVQKNIEEGFPVVHVPAQPDFTFSGFEFYRLPHPKGDGQNVGSPFNKDFIKTFFAEKIMRPTRFVDEFEQFVDAGKVTRFWTNYRDRYNEQIACWLDESNNTGAIAPAIIPAGTITRRAVHKLWLTSANAKEGMLGSELKSMVQASPGWKLVGADVDSQEQWLAALYGDVLQGSHKAGSTPFSNMQLAGSKSDNTDLHSVVAKTVGINRNSAKVLNYARLYGSGINHAIEFLVQQGVQEAEAKEISQRLFETTKGFNGKYRELQPHLIQHFEHFVDVVCPKECAKQHLTLGDRVFLCVDRGANGTQSGMFEDWLRHNMSTDLKDAGVELDGNGFYRDVYKGYPMDYNLFKGGFESDTFNYLELCARNPEPRTPVLDCRLTRALEPLPSYIAGADDFQQRYKRTVINWVVQSSAVDFLHLLLVCMEWLFKEYGIQGRFVISIHDEIRFLVHEDDKYRCALALSLANMLVRAAIMEKVGIKEMPKSIAFFSQVDIDTVLRKEVDSPCTLPNGEEVPPGEGLSIEDIIEKTNGSLQKQ